MPSSCAFPLSWCALNRIRALSLSLEFLVESRLLALALAAAPFCQTNRHPSYFTDAVNESSRPGTNIFIAIPSLETTSTCLLQNPRVYLRAYYEAIDTATFSLADI